MQNYIVFWFCFFPENILETNTGTHLIIKTDKKAHDSTLKSNRPFTAHRWIHLLTQCSFMQTLHYPVPIAMITCVAQWMGGYDIQITRPSCLTWRRHTLFQEKKLHECKRETIPTMCKSFLEQTVQLLWQHCCCHTKQHVRLNNVLMNKSSKEKLSYNANSLIF